MAMPKIVFELIGQILRRHLLDSLKQKRVAVRLGTNYPSEPIPLQVSDHRRVRIQRIQRIQQSKSWQMGMVCTKPG